MYMRILSAISFVVLVLNSSCLCAQNSENGRLKYSINSNWEFSLDPAEIDDASSMPDSLWSNINLPHTWNALDVLDDTPGYYRGTGWYKKEIPINEVQANGRVYIYFEGANQVSWVYVNGQYAGEHIGGYNAFSFDITPFVNKDQSSNVIYVKVNNAYSREIPPHNADFSFYGGIYRDVYLIITQPVHFDVLDMASSGVYISTP